MKQFIIFISICLFASYLLLVPEENKMQISVKTEPEQIKTYTEPFKHNDFNIKPLYDYNIKALVLSKRKYTSKTESEISTYDLALGWEEMADLNNTNRIKISQRNRWYYWNVDEFFITRKQIEHNSSNHHIIHANNSILDKLKEVEKNDVVHLKGHLVYVTKENTPNWFWKSSTTRKDIGDGACEVFYVYDIEILN